jgi:hypothetical protein
METRNQIATGRITFSTDGFFIQFVDNGQFIDLSGAATRQENFDENAFNHKLASLRGHMGRRGLDGDSSGPSVTSFVASRIALKSAIETRAFFLSLECPHASALGNWLRAERELLSE